MLWRLAKAVFNSWHSSTVSLLTSFMQLCSKLTCFRHTSGYNYNFHLSMKPVLLQKSTQLWAPATLLKIMRNTRGMFWTSLKLMGILLNVLIVWGNLIMFKNKNHTKMKFYLESICDKCLKPLTTEDIRNLPCWRNVLKTIEHVMHRHICWIFDLVFQQRLYSQTSITTVITCFHQIEFTKSSLPICELVSFIQLIQGVIFFLVLLHHGSLLITRCSLELLVGISFL